MRISGELEKKLQILGIQFYLLFRNQQKIGKLYYGNLKKKRSQAIQPIRVPIEKVPSLSEVYNSSIEILRVSVDIVMKALIPCHR